MENIKVSLSAEAGSVTISATVANMPVSVDLADFKREVEKAISEAYKSAIGENWKDINFTKVKHDINGNPRFAVGFNYFVKDEEKKLPVSQQYEIAVKRAKAIGGKKYNGKDYGGGICFQCYSNEIQRIATEIMQLTK
jgi:hypothetical protein